jgi:hypothetical protein
LAAAADYAEIAVYRSNGNKNNDGNRSLQFSAVSSAAIEPDACLPETGIGLRN